MFSGKNREVASISIEHSMIKLLVCRGLTVVDYRVLLMNSKFFREGQVSNAVRVSDLVQNVLAEMSGDCTRVVGAVPGFQNTMRVLELPRSAGLNPRVAIPLEARRLMQVSTETYHLRWYRLRDRLDRTRWLVVASSRRSIASLLDVAQKAGIKVTKLEPTPFPLARAVNQPDAIVAWATQVGCDVIILKDSVPVAHQSMFWGTESVESTVLVNRLTEITGRTAADYEATSDEGPLAEDVAVYVCGSPIGRDPGIALQVAENLGRPAGGLAPPLICPADFPVHDLVVNIGLVLREV